MRLGDFDPPEMVAYNKIDSSVIQSPEHQELAIKTAMRSYVLMKNDGNVLPLKKKFGTLAVGCSDIGTFSFEIDTSGKSSDSRLCWMR